MSSRTCSDSHHMCRRRPSSRGRPDVDADPVLAQRSRHQGRPVSEGGARRGPAGRIAGDPGRSRVTSGASSRQNRSTAARSGSRTVTRSTTSNGGSRRADHARVPRRPLPGIRPASRPAKSRPPDALEDHLAGRARLGLGIAAHHRQHAAGRPAVAIDRHQLEPVRRRVPGRPRHRHAIGPRLASIDSRVKSTSTSGVRYRDGSSIS